MPDGYIEFSVKLDAKEAEGELSRIKKKIRDLEMELAEQKGARSDLEEKLQKAGDAAERAKAKIEELTKQRDRLMGAPGVGDQSAKQIRIQELTGEISAQESIFQGYVKEADAAVAALQKQDDKIADTTRKIENQKLAYGQVQKEALAAGNSGSAASEQVSKRLEKLTGKIATLAKRVFFFTLFTRAFRAIRDYVGSALQTNKEFVAATARLRAALLTAFQPIYSAAVPALISLINTLSSAISVIAQFVSLLFGSTVEASAAAAESLDAEAKALNAVGGGAKKASKSLASFDEINQLAGESGGGGGGGSGKGASSAFEVSPGSLDSWDDLGKKILGVTGIVAALGLAFGNVAGGIAAVIGGFSLFTDGFRDAEKNGMTLYNTLEMVAGLLLSGIGIGLLTGKWFPVLIAAIGGLLLTLAYFTGHGEELLGGLRKTFDGLITFISGVFTGDWNKAMQGAAMMAEGLRETWKAVCASMEDAVNLFFNWLDEKTNGKFAGIIGAIKNFMIGLLRFVTGVFTGDWNKAMQGAAMMAEGLRETWKAVWASMEDAVNLFFNWLDEETNGKYAGIIGTIKNFLIGLLRFVRQILDGVIDLITGAFTLDWEKAWGGLKGIFVGILNGIITAFEFGINLMISGINAAQGAIVAIANHIPGVDVGLNPASPVTLPRVPALATGAVIPPNREFLAVLGDQRSGTNIEAPLDTMVQAFRQALREGGGGQRTLVLQVGERELGRIVFDAYNAESTRVGATIGGFV